MAQETPKTVKSDERLLSIIEAIQDLNGDGITEIANQLSIPEGSAHRHVSVLVEQEYVVREGDEFALSFRFLNLGGYVRRNNAAAKRIGDRVEQLAEETGELSAYLVEEYGEAVYVERGIGENAVGTDAGIGKRFPHTHAGRRQGHPRGATRRIHRRNRQEAGLQSYTKNTITDYDELLAELEETRERGYTLDEQEHIKGLNAVAAPVHGPIDDLRGSLSVAGPSHRLKGEWFETEIPELILGVVNEFKLDIAYS